MSIEVSQRTSIYSVQHCLRCYTLYRCQPKQETGFHIVLPTRSSVLCSVFLRVIQSAYNYLSFLLLTFQSTSCWEIPYWPLYGLNCYSIAARTVCVAFYACAIIVHAYFRAFFGNTAAAMHIAGASSWCQYTCTHSLCSKVI